LPIKAGSQIRNERSPAKAGLLFVFIASQSASDFLANRIAGGIARAASLADRRAFPDDNLIALADLRLTGTNRSTDTGANGGTNWPADGKAHARAHSGACSRITGCIWIRACQRRKGG
jgi:hypothetical protein